MRPGDETVFRGEEGGVEHRRKPLDLITILRFFGKEKRGNEIDGPDRKNPTSGEHPWKDIKNKKEGYAGSRSWRHLRKRRAGGRTPLSRDLSLIPNDN